MKSRTTGLSTFCVGDSPRHVQESGCFCRERGENHLGQICPKCFPPVCLALYLRAWRYAPTPAAILPRDMPIDEESRNRVRTAKTTSKTGRCSHAFERRRALADRRAESFFRRTGSRGPTTGPYWPCKGPSPPPFQPPGTQSVLTEITTRRRLAFARKSYGRFAFGWANGIRRTRLPGRRGTIHGLLSLSPRFPIRVLLP